MNGKTTLLRRLKGLPFKEERESTKGIDIDTWKYPDQKKYRLSFKGKRLPITFLAWDFAGQVRVSIIYIIDDCVAGYPEQKTYLRNTVGIIMPNNTHRN